MFSDGDSSDFSDTGDDDYKTTTKKKSGKSTENGVYRIRNVLKVSRATTYTAQALYDQIHNSDINLEPEYQRDVVWPENKQIGLIDSVFRNFYIPPVIFAVNAFEDGSEVKTCIDGKQRLTSIHRFMDGLIPHRDHITGEKLWYKDAGQGGRARKILPEKYRRLFANKQIVCVEYQDITDSDEREIFQRVQLGMALTPAEKLQVISTPKASFIRELQASFLNDDGSLAGEALEWDRSRGGDFRCLSQAIYCIEKYPNQKTAGTITQIEKWLHADEPLPSPFRNKIHDTYQVFSDLVLDKAFNKVFKKPAKISPIEFIMISVLIGAHKDKLSMAQLSSAIGQMRDGVRAAHVDIRMNGRVAKTMLDFIKGLKPNNLNGAGGEPAGSLVGRKRKRMDQEDSPPITKRSTAHVSQMAAPLTIPRNDNSKKISSTSQLNKPTPPASRPVPDRIAAVRTAKSAANLHQTSSAPALVRDPKILPDVPLLLPSPGTSFSFTGQTTQSVPHNPLEASLMASMSRPKDVRPHLDHPLPQPPASGNGERQDRRPNPVTTDIYGSRYHSRDWSKERDRDKDRDRDRDHYGGQSTRSSGFTYPSSDSGWNSRVRR